MSTRIDAPSSPKLPPELLRPIISNLSVQADRRTLCNAALTSTLLAQECQRVLFRTTTDSFWKLNTLRRHILFLGAIIRAPTRLGPLVHEYTQHNLAMDASGYPIPGIAYPTVSECAYNSIILSLDDSQDMTLWDLSMAALPAMINLKHLRFSTRNIPSEYSLEVLRKCAFQLISLSWALPLYHHGIDDDAEAFLTAQSGVVHLDLSHFAKPISEVACPSLISIRATHRMWADLCLKDNRCIRALDVVENLITPAIPGAEDNIDQGTQSDLIDYADQIRLLSYSSYTKMQSAFSDMPLRNLVLLRLLTYTTINLLQFSGFDCLRVLVLHKFTRESFSEGTVSSHLTFIFQRNANVRYVDVLTEHNEVFQRYYRPALDAMDPRPTVRLFRGNQTKALWWECHLDEANYTLQAADDDSLDPDDSLSAKISSLNM